MIFPSLKSQRVEMTLFFLFCQTMRGLLLLFILIPLFAVAQELKVVPIERIPLVADQFVGADEYKNLYTITGRVFYKTSTEKTYRFSDLQLGPISSVDLINPLRITLFYNQTNTALILDNTLNEITRVNFNQLEDFRNVSHARTASERRLWIFNIDRQQLELFDYQTNKIITSSPPLSATAVGMTSNFNRCYVYTGKELKIYNNYGSLLNSVAILGLSQLHQNNDVLFALRNEIVVMLPKDKMDFVEVNLDEKQIEQLYYANEFLYIYRLETLTTYSLKLPKN